MVTIESVALNGVSIVQSNLATGEQMAVFAGAATQNGLSEEEKN